MRDECTKHGILLIFDEIVTGFRFAYGGAQDLYGVTPDICTLGKIIGGGFPLAAIAASAEIMSCFDRAKTSENKWLMQLGTLSGNPIAAAAGLKTMEILRRDGAYDQLRKTGEIIQNLIAKHLSAVDIPHQIVGDKTLFDVLFLDRPPQNYRDVIQADAAKNARFNGALRAMGIFKSPGKLYPSLAISPEDIAKTDMAFAAAANSIA